MLETLQDEKLPRFGPGRAPDGNFVLSEIELKWGAGTNAPNTVAKFVDAKADFSQNDFSVKQAIDGKKLIETIDAEFQALGQRIFLSGGLLVEIGKAATRRAERDKTVQRIKDVVAEIDATGVQVKDLDMGLLDFPCVVDGNTILLCWKMGEDKITHWHGVDEGYAGRKPIDENIKKLKKKPN